MAYKELMKLGKEEVERLCKLYEKEVISVSCSKNYQTGEIFYHEPVPEGAIPVHKICRQEDAIPLGWHRNAHENTLGTLFIFKLA